MPNGKGLLVDYKNNKVYLEGIFKDGIIVSGKYFKEKDKVFEGEFFYDDMEKEESSVEKRDWNIY